LAEDGYLHGVETDFFLGFSEGGIEEGCISLERSALVA
jgi:hypothetical protein